MIVVTTHKEGRIFKAFGIVSIKEWQRMKLGKVFYTVGKLEFL
jgi:hypothetical protein